MTESLDGVSIMTSFSTRISSMPCNTYTWVHSRKPCTPARHILKTTIFLEPKESMRSSSTTSFSLKERVCVSSTVESEHTHTAAEDQCRQRSGWEHRRPGNAFDIHFTPPLFHRKRSGSVHKMLLLKLGRDVKREKYI